MQTSLKLPAIACFLCFFALDAIHIQVNPTPSIANQDPSLIKASVTGTAQFTSANVQHVVQTSFNGPVISHIAKTVNLMAANGTQLNLVSGGKCSNSEVAHLFSVQSQMQDLLNKTPGGAHGKAQHVRRSATSTELDPKAVFSCGKSVMKFDWPEIEDCFHAVSGTSHQCSSCFVKGLKDTIGESMFSIPFSCFGKCLLGAGEVSEECKSCMAHNVEKVLECTGIDLAKFGQGAAEVVPTPLGGGASSVLPHWAVTFLLGAVTLGVALIF